MSRILRRGALAGLGAGAALALFLRLVAGPVVDRAVALEASGHQDVEEELFSRGAQHLGGMAGALVYGVCLGVITALVLAAVRRRSTSGDQWRQGMAMGVVGFVTLVLVPFLKYPANPPGVGDPGTIGRRTVLYLAMLAWSVLASWLWWRFWAELRERGWPEHRRAAATAVGYAASVVAAFILLPGSPEVVDAPAWLLWGFRVASLGGSALFWAVLGWGLGRPLGAGLASGGPSRAQAQTT